MLIQVSILSGHSLNKTFVIFFLILFGGCTSTARQKLGFGYTKCAEDLIHNGYMQAGVDKIPLEDKFNEAEIICSNSTQKQIELAKKMWDAHFYYNASFNQALADVKNYSLNQLSCAEEEFKKNTDPDKHFTVTDNCKNK